MNVENVLRNMKRSKEEAGATLGSPGDRTAIFHYGRLAVLATFLINTQLLIIDDTWLFSLWNVCRFMVVTAAVLPDSQLTQVIDVTYSNTHVLSVGHMVASASSLVPSQWDSHVEKSQWTTESESRQLMLTQAYGLQEQGLVEWGEWREPLFRWTLKYDQGSVQTEDASQWHFKGGGGLNYMIDLFRVLTDLDSWKIKAWIITSPNPALKKGTPPPTNGSRLSSINGFSVGFDWETSTEAWYLNPLEWLWWYLMDEIIEKTLIWNS